MRKKLSALLLSALSIIFIMGILSIPASAAQSISKATVSYTSSYVYTGKAIKPKVTVKLKGKTLKSGTNYTVSYKNNTNVGTGTITVTGKGSYSGKITKSFYILPKQVTGVKSTGQTDTKIELSWSKVTGATNYQVYRYVSSSKSWKLLGTVAKTSCTVPNLSGATNYKFKIRAINTKSSKTLQGEPSAAFLANTAPAKVKNIKAVSYPLGLELSWSKVSGASQYEVHFYNSSKKAWVKMKTVSGTNATIESLKSGTTYNIKVRALCKLNNKVTNGVASDSFYASTRPATPPSFKASSLTSSSVKLSWSAPKGVTSYEVYVNEYDKNGKETSYQKYRTLSETSLTVSGLKDCRTYRIRVRAYMKPSKGAAVYSYYSYTPVFTTKPATVSGFYCSDFTNTSATLSWDQNSNVTGYQLYWDNDETGEKELLATLPNTKTSYIVSGLEELTPYKFYIKSYHTVSSSKTNYSAEKSVNVKTDDATVKDIVFTKTKTSLPLESTYTVKAQVIPSYATNQKVYYSSSNTSVATISSSGKITAKTLGTTVITARSDEGGFETSYTLTVTKVKSTALNAPAVITLFVGYPAKLAPEFVPANTTDKDFTVSYKNYTYSYKTALGKTQTSTCNFTDFITVSGGTFTAKKATTHLSKDNLIGSDEYTVFGFDVTFKAKDSGVTKTVKVQVVDTPPSFVLKDNSDNAPWYCGNTSKLTVELGSYIYFKESELIWESSNTDIATVDKKGNITCKGFGEVVITAYSPYKALKAQYTIFSRSSAKIAKNYFENCKVGDTYKIDAQLLPADSPNGLVFTSVDSSVASVDSEGNVKINAEGAANVIVSIANQPADNFNVWFTTDSCELPAETGENLFYLFKERANALKNTASLRGFTRTDITKTTDVTTNNLIADGKYASLADFESDIVMPILNANAQPKTSYVNSVSASDADWNKKYQTYINKIPVAGSPLTIMGDLKYKDHVKSIEIIDDGSYHYSIKMILNDESFTSLPQNPSLTAHGQVFDILTKGYIANIIGSSGNNDAKINMSYSSYKTKYHDSYISMKIDKVTGLVSGLEYSMNIDSDIKSLYLDMSYSFISMKFTADVSFKSNNIITIDFFN